MTDAVKLNVGGVLYQTTQHTLTKDQDSMLASMFSGRHPLKTDENGYHFIDRDGKLFEYILKFLRDGNIRIDNLEENTIKNILDEANYYNISGLIKFLQTCVKVDNDVDIIKKICAVKNFDIEQFEQQFNKIFTLEFVVRRGGCYVYKRSTDTSDMSSSGCYYSMRSPSFRSSSHYDYKKAFDFLDTVVDEIGLDFFKILFSRNIIKTQYKSVYWDLCDLKFEI